MKTERRHELQTNTLAASLAEWIETVKPYSRAILAGTIALVVAIFAWTFLSAQRARQLADGWSEYYQAMTSRDPRNALSDIAERYAGTSVSEWAELALADFQLDEGTTRLFHAKNAGRDELKQAVDKYQTVRLGRKIRSLSSAPPLAWPAHEALGMLDKVREDYLEIAQKWPDSAYVKAANTRANQLGETKTKAFYDWFEAYQPPAPMTGEPGAARAASEVPRKGGRRERRQRAQVAGAR